MRSKRRLRIHERVLLLGLRDEQGTVESKAGMFRYALGGAILAELLLEDRITVTDDKKKLVNVVKTTPVGDPVIDEALKRIASAKRRRNAGRWVSSLAGLKRIRHRIAEGLCRRGILKDAEDKVLLIFTRRIYPTIDPAPERELVDELREAVLGDSDRLDPRTAILTALADGTGLLRVHFDKKTLKRRKARLERIARGDVIGGAAREAVQAARAAAAAAVIATSVVTTTTAVR